MAETEKSTTLFPQTNGKAKEFTYRVEYLKENDAEFAKFKSMELIGTVKLHGTHADIVVKGNAIRFQSRNMLNITPGKQTDVHEFATTFTPLIKPLLALNSRILARWKELSGKKPVWNSELIIAGEWLGPGIQKGVAINKLENKQFVIFGLCLNGIWLPTEPYADIEDPSINIYHVSRGGFYRHTLPLDLIEGIDESFATLQPLADAAEKECPYAKTFGISGQGEGIVFKPVDAKLCRDEKFWFKLKGPLNSRRPVPVNKAGQQADKKERVNTYSQGIVNEMRLEQGWEYMSEMKILKDVKGVQAYLTWLKSDVEKEEGREIRDAELDKGMVMGEVSRIGRAWYLARVKEE